MSRFDPEVQELARKLRDELLEEFENKDDARYQTLADEAAEERAARDEAAIITAPGMTVSMPIPRWTDILDQLPVLDLLPLVVERSHPTLRTFIAGRRKRPAGARRFIVSDADHGVIYHLAETDVSVEVDAEFKPVVRGSQTGPVPARLWKPDSGLGIDISLPPFPSSRRGIDRD